MEPAVTARGICLEFFVQSPRAESPRDSNLDFRVRFVWQLDSASSGLVELAVCPLIPIKYGMIGSHSFPHNIG
jgi:hypothetical protein